VPGRAATPPAPSPPAHTLIAVAPKGRRDYAHRAMIVIRDHWSFAGVIAVLTFVGAVALIAAGKIALAAALVAVVVIAAAVVYWRRGGDESS
jgi:hypothetical protein